LSRASDAIVTIVAYRDGSTEVTSGTGVRLSDGRVITALRHLRGAARAEIYGPEGDQLAVVTTLDQADVKLDLAVLPRLATTGAGLVLARRSAAVAQKVSLLGARKGTARAIADRTVTHVEPDENGRPLLRIGAPISGSAVGSAVVNARGELLGLAVGSIPGKEDGDVAIDVAALREVLARPAMRLGFPARDGTIAAARSAPAESRPGATAPRTGDAAARPRGSSIFPERFGAPISVDTARTWTVELFGCLRIESRQKVYCYLRVTNLASSATFTVNGADLADSTRRKLREAENLVQGETSQRLAGWRSKAAVPIRELESVRLAVEFPPPEKEADAVRLILDISGERTLWLGPFVLQRVP
jgi:hypothetical protein